MDRSPVAIIDIHTHAFPDELAPRAVSHLAQTGNVRPSHDGTITGLRESMDSAGIDRAVVLSIATKPAQFDGILEWSRRISSPRIVPFPSFHPADPQAVHQIRRIREAGFRGVKLHPYYQDFAVDEERMLPLFAALEREGLAVLIHAGYDIAFPRYRLADPERLGGVIHRFPSLDLVVSHLGGWHEWDAVERHLLGRPVYLDLAFTSGHMGRDLLERFLREHPAEYLLFGSDSPWADQARELEAFRAILPDDGLREKVLGGNALRLLGE